MIQITLLPGTAAAAADRRSVSATLHLSQGFPFSETLLDVVCPAAMQTIRVIEVIILR